MLVTGVSAGSGAAVAGIRPGDLIGGVDGRLVGVLTDIASILKGHAAGDSVKVAIGRNGQTSTFTVVLSARAA